MRRIILLGIMVLGMLLSVSGMANSNPQKQPMILLQNNVADQVHIQKICVYYAPAKEGLAPCHSGQHPTQTHCLPDCQTITDSQPGYVFQNGKMPDQVTRIALIGETIAHLRAECLPYGRRSGEAWKALLHNKSYLASVNFVVYNDMVCSFKMIP